MLNTIDSNRYTIALVLDGDNIMLSGVLNNINDAFNNGANCVQVHRTAKNTNNRLALLDALSEEINNELFRKGQRALGFSAALIGSGMAFRFEDLKRFYNKPGILDNPACDREVDFEITKAGRTVEYLDEAYVLDEKVSRNKVFENQRRRWMESQLIHLRLFFTESPATKTKDFWNKFFLNLIPPRILVLGLFFLVFTLYLLQYWLQLSAFRVHFDYWLILFCLYLLTFLVSIPGKFYRIETAAALLYLPVIVFTYCKALVGLKPRRKEFVHTPKSFTGEK